MGEDLARAFVSFFAIIDPIGNVLVFYLLTRGLALQKQILVAGVAVITAYLLIIVFVLSGDRVLDFLGISLESFSVAAGLLLLMPAYRLVSEGQPMNMIGREELAPDQIALVPLATPLLAGPGALAVAISFTGDFGRGVTIGASTAVLALSFALFVGSTWLFLRLGPSPLRLLARVIGILLFSIAVDLILDGLDTIFDS